MNNRESIIKNLAKVFPDATIDVDSKGWPYEVKVVLVQQDEFCLENYSPAKIAAAFGPDVRWAVWEREYARAPRQLDEYDFDVGQPAVITLIARPQ